MTDAASNVSTVLQALTALYHHDDPAVKEQANKWLEQWQQTPGAWQVADAFLHNATDNMEAQYFFAQTLKLKVQRDFEELPEAAALQLRSSLLQLLVHFATGVAAVRTQLCIALAACAAHVPGALWGPRGVLGWLHDCLLQQPRQVALTCLLEMMVILPQEASSYRVAIRPERRRQLNDELKQQFPLALTLLVSCLTESGELAPQVLEAFGAWLKLAGLPDVDSQSLCTNPLVVAALQGLAKPALFDMSVDVLCDLLSCVSRGGRPLQQHMALAVLVTQQVIALRPRFLAVARTVQAEKENREPSTELGTHSHHDDDEETAKGMARLFAEVAEGFVGMVAAGTPDMMQVVELMVDVAAFPEDTICAMSFNFWSDLVHELTSQFAPQPIDDGPAPQVVAPEEQARRLALFMPVFERLVLLIRGRVRYPVTWATWHQDEKAEFRRSRYAIGDTLLDAGKVLGSEKLLALLVQPLQQLSQQVSAGGEFDWRAAEAALYCLRAVHRVSPPPCDPMLVALLSSLPQLPTEPMLRYTAALMVGSYSSWIDSSLRAGLAPEPVLNLLQMLTQGFALRDTAPACALALRNVCEACEARLTAAMPVLGNLYSQVTSPNNNLALEEDEVQQVMEATCCVVGQLPGEQHPAASAALVGPVSQQLSAVLAAVGQTDNSAAVVQQLDRLSVVLRHIREQATVAQLLQACWPQLSAVLEAYGGSERITERASRCLRYGLRNSGKQSVVILPQLLQNLPRHFAAHKHSSYLYVASELIKMFGSEATRAGDLGLLVSGMLQPACYALQSLKDFNNNPELADDTFLMASRALTYCPSIMMTPEVLPTMLDTALKGVLVQHREACSSILTFLIRIFDLDLLQHCPADAKAHLAAAISPRADLLVRLLLAGIVGALPSSRETDLSDALFAIIQAMQQNAVQLVGNAVASIPEGAASAAERNAFAQAVAALVTGAGNRKSLQDAVEELSEVCRRNRRARDAAQLALLPAELHWVVAGS